MEKTDYQKVIDGDVEAVGIQKGWSNLKSLKDRPKEEQLEIRRKAQKAQTEKRRELKTMKEALSVILESKDMARVMATATNNQTLIDFAESGCTVNELLMMSATLQGLDGNVKALEFVRDTNGQRPKDQIDVQADVITASDRALIEKLRKNLSDNDE